MKRFNSFRLKKKPEKANSLQEDKLNTMANTETTASSSSLSSSSLGIKSMLRNFTAQSWKNSSNLSPAPSQEQLEVIKAGWLTKLGALVKSWNSRWFILRAATLSYYTNEDELKQQGCINLSKVECVECLEPSEHDKYPFQIVMRGDRSRVNFTREKYLIHASTEEERKAWTEAITGVMESLRSPSLMQKEIETVPAIFGQDLTDIMDYEGKTSSRKVPQIVEQCVEFLLKYGLKTEGIFRLPGRTILVKQLKDQFDNGERPEFEPPEIDVHSVASLLKMFLRDLPQPLVTLEFYDAIMTLCLETIPTDRDVAIVSLSKLLSELPRHNYNILQYICHFLDEVSQLEETNKMTATNLAKIFVQSFLRPDTDSPEVLMTSLGARIQAVNVLVKHWRVIFKREYNNQGCLVEVDTLIDLGAGSEHVKKFSARTSVNHTKNFNRKMTSRLFDNDINAELMQPLTPVATPFAVAPVEEEEEEEDVTYDRPNPTNSLIKEFDIDMNGKDEKDEEEEAIYDIPQERPPSKSISLPVSSKLTDPDDSKRNSKNLRDSNSNESCQSADNISKDYLKVPNPNERRLSAPSPLAPPRPSKRRHTKQIDDSPSPIPSPNPSPTKPHLITIPNTDNDISLSSVQSEPSSDNQNSNTSLADSVTDSGHHGSESDSNGDGPLSPFSQSSDAMCTSTDVLPLSSISTLGSSNSSSQQSVNSDLQDVKLCEISSSGGSSFSLNDLKQDDMLLGMARGNSAGNNDALHMSLLCGNKAAARRSRASLMEIPASPTVSDRPSVTSTSDSSIDKLDDDDLVIQRLTEKDASVMTKEELVAHVSELSTELKIQRKKVKTATSKLTVAKKKHTEKIVGYAKQLDVGKTETASAVDKIIQLQGQLNAYQMKFGKLDESVFGKTSFYG